MSEILVIVVHDYPHCKKNIFNENQSRFENVVRY